MKLRVILWSMMVALPMYVFGYSTWDDCWDKYYLDSYKIHKGYSIFYFRFELDERQDVILPGPDNSAVNTWWVMEKTPKGKVVDQGRQAVASHVKNVRVNGKLIKEEISRNKLYAISKENMPMGKNTVTCEIWFEQFPTNIIWLDLVEARGNIATHGTYTFFNLNLIELGHRPVPDPKSFEKLPVIAKANLKEKAAQVEQTKPNDHGENSKKIQYPEVLKTSKYATILEETKMLQAIKAQAESANSKDADKPEFISLEENLIDLEETMAVEQIDKLETAEQTSIYENPLSEREIPDLFVDKQEKKQERMIKVISEQNEEYAKKEEIAKSMMKKQSDDANIWFNFSSAIPEPILVRVNGDIMSDGYVMACEFALEEAEKYKIQIYIKDFFFPIKEHKLKRVDNWIAKSFKIEKKKFKYHMTELNTELAGF